MSICLILLWRNRCRVFIVTALAAVAAGVDYYAGNNQDEDDYGAEGYQGFLVLIFLLFLPLFLLRSRNLQIWPVYYLDYSNICNSLSKELED